MITFDLGFANMRNYPPEDGPGCIVLRQGSQSRAHCLFVLRRLMDALEIEPLEGRLWIVEDTKIRIRGGSE